MPEAESSPVTGLMATSAQCWPTQGWDLSTVRVEFNKTLQETIFLKACTKMKQSHSCRVRMRRNFTWVQPSDWTLAGIALGLKTAISLRMWMNQSHRFATPWNIPELALLFYGCVIQGHVLRSYTQRLHMHNVSHIGISHTNIILLCTTISVLTHFPSQKSILQSVEISSF